MLEGLAKIRADDWQLQLTPAQQRVVDNLLLESESHIIFAREALFPAAGTQLTGEEATPPIYGFAAVVAGSHLRAISLVS
jgi:hypothetical protein